MYRFTLGFLATAITVGLGMFSPAAAADRPVPWTFSANILAAPTGPDTPPPGANDWSCEPTAAHPEPVVLVHGLFATQTDDWQTYGPLLANHGYCVFSLTYGNQASQPWPMNDFGGLPAMEQSATVLGEFVDKVLAATGASKVDLVGHSEGATMPYWYLKYDGGAAKVAKMVGLAPVVHGTGAPSSSYTQLLAAFGLPLPQDTDWASYCEACTEFSPDSDFIRKLDDGPITVSGVDYTQIVTEDDELVVPYTSGIIDEPGSTNFVVQDQCPLDGADHLAIVSDPVAARDVLNALDPAHAEPVPCTVVLPVIG